MSCKSCSTGGCGTSGKGTTKVSGCKNNGACGTGGCNKMNVFDWLSNMDTPMVDRYDAVEVKFKGGRKEYFRNTQKIELYAGDAVIVEVPSGHHLGVVALQGELVRLQILKKGLKDDNLPVIYRKATDKDLEKNEQAVARDLPTMYRTREIVNELNLNMKVSDVEFQADGTKATFYYSSDERVDFRELIKALAGEFKVRVEMKQINLRQEAARVGGIGVCGRELCCTTWLTDFRNVTTSAARYQNLSLNPVKLSGQCGRLKCCLNYELETYMDALKDIPTVEGTISTQKGEATLQKTDIFRKTMWFSYPKEDNWYPVAVERVKEIQELNKMGIKPISFEDLNETLPVENTLQTSATLNSDLDKYNKYDKNKRKNQDKPRFNEPRLPKNERPPRPEQRQGNTTPNAERNANRPPQQARPEQRQGNTPPNTERNTNRPPQQPRPEQRQGTPPPNTERNTNRPPQQRQGNTPPNAERNANRPPQQPRPEQRQGNTPPNAERNANRPPNSEKPQSQTGGTESPNTERGEKRNNNNRRPFKK